MAKVISIVAHIRTECQHTVCACTRRPKDAPFRRCDRRGRATTLPMSRNSCLSSALTPSRVVPRVPLKPGCACRQPHVLRRHRVCVSAASPLSVDPPTRPVRVGTPGGVTMWLRIAWGAEVPRWSTEVEYRGCRARLVARVAAGGVALPGGCRVMAFLSTERAA
jgi:hypothetical protein